MTADTPPRRPDAALDKPDANQADLATRTRLSQTMLDGVNRGDRVVQAAQTQGTDRAAFRQDIARRAQAMNDSLHAASQSMKQFNLEAQNGQLRPGTQDYLKAYQQAMGGYKQAIDMAAGQLLQADAQGKPVASDLSKQVAEEQQLVAKEKQFLKQKVQSGQNLSTEEAQQLGVNTTDARQAFKQKKDQSEMLNDFQHALVYAQANCGLAMIRSSATMPGQQKQQRIEAGEMMIQQAGTMDAAMDGSMARDSNFWAHYINDYQKAGVAPKRQPPQDLDRPDPTDLPPNPGTPATAGDGRDQAQLPGNSALPQNNNRYRLPSGNANPDADGFVDPGDLLKKADDQVRQETAAGAKLSQDDINNYKAAMAAADSVDRKYLEGRMPKEKAFLDEKRNGNADLRSAVQAEQTLIAADANLEKGIKSLAANVAKTAGDGVLPMIDDMSKLQTVADLQKFAEDNKDAIAAMSKAPAGQQLFQQIKTRVANNEQLNVLDQKIAKIDPDYAKVATDLSRHQRLYLSSVDARAHAVLALGAHAQEDASFAPAARNMMLQMASMDRALPKDAQFMQMSRAFGIAPEDLNRVVTGQTKPGDAASSDQLNPVGIKPDTSDSATIPEKALALYNSVMQHVKQGQPINDQEQKQFEDMIQQAGQLDPDGVKQQDQKLQELSRQLGGGKPVEQTVAALAQSNGPDAQQRLNQYINRQDVSDYLKRRQRFDVAVHGDKVTEGIYGLALLRGSNDQTKQDKAKALLTDAATDKVASQTLKLNAIMDQLSSGHGPATDLGTPGAPAKPGDTTNQQGPKPGQPQTDPLYQYVPGMENRVNAEQILKNTPNPQEALTKVRPELDKAIQLSDQINPQQEQQKFANPQAMVGKDGKLTNDAVVAMNRDAEPVRARILYANALNHAAVDLYQQADKDPDHSGDLRQQADKLNTEAIQKLQEIGQKDKQYGTLNPDNVEQAKRTVDGLIIQAQHHEAMDGNTAAARSYGETAKTGVDVGLNTFGATGIAPVSATLDGLDVTMRAASKVPLLGQGLTALGLNGFPTPSWEVRPGVVKDLTMAKLNDPDTAKKIVAEGKQQTKNTWVHTGIDLLSGPGAIYAAEKAGSFLANYIPNPVVRLGAQGLLAIGGGLAAEKGLDWAANKTIGSDQLTTDQWLSHSLASVGMAAVGRGAMELTSRWAAAGVADGASVKAASQLSPKLAGSLELNGSTEAARAYQLGRGLKVASSDAQDAVVAARTRQNWFFQKGQHWGEVAADQKLVDAAKFSEQAPQLGDKVSTAQFVKNETGAELGSRWSYVKPQNILDGLKQRTLQIGDDGKLVGSIRDLNSRMIWSKVAPAAAGGGLAAGVYSWSDVNPWLTKADGTKYTPEEIAQHTAWNGAMGGLASGVFAPAVPAIGHFVADQFIGTGKLIGRGLQWVAPDTYKAVAASRPAQAVGSAIEGVSNTAGASRDWLLAPQKDLSTIMAEPRGVQNAVNTWTRGYAPYMSLPIYNGVASRLYGNYVEWNEVDKESERNAAIIRERNEEAQKKDKPAQQQGK